MSTYPDEALGILIDTAAGGMVTGIAGCSVYAHRQVVARRGTGIAPIPAWVPRGIASVTKAITGTLLADMALREELSLEASVGEMLPTCKLPEYWFMVSLADLVYHRSGLPVLPPNFYGPWWNPYRDWGRHELGVAMCQLQIDAPPANRAVHYSNFGFAVLGEVLSQRATLPFGLLVEQRFVQPLGLRATALTSESSPRPRPYSRSGQPLPYWDWNAMSSAGGLASTVDDLLTVGEAMLRPGASAVGPALRKATLPGEEVTPTTSFGMGWKVSHLGRATLVWALGGIHGSAAFLGIHLEAEIVVAAILDGGSPSRLAQASFEAMSCLTGEHRSNPKP